MILVVMVLGQTLLTFGQEGTTPRNQLHGEVEFEIEVRNGNVRPQVKTYLTYGGKNRFGVYCWIQNSKSYNQAYCGPKVAMKPWLEVGVAVGVQTGPKRFQAGAFVWAGKPIKGKMVSNLFVIEKGGTWYRNVTSVQINKLVKVSLVKQRYQGIGGRLDFTLGRGFSTSVESLYDKTSVTKVGMKYSF